MSSRLGIIAGSAFLDGADLADARLETVRTPAGDVALHLADDYAFIRRHSEAGYRPPHRVPHHSHVLALESIGVSRVAGLASTGALRDHLQPGDVLVPADYLSMHPPPTLHATSTSISYPFSIPMCASRCGPPRSTRCQQRERRSSMAASTPRLHGPRFETAAEFRMLA